LEEAPDASVAEQMKLLKDGRYPKNDSLNNHVDPRTYDYLQRIFARAHIPETRVCRKTVAEVPTGVIVSRWKSHRSPPI